MLVGPQQTGIVVGAVSVVEPLCKRKLPAKAPVFKDIARRGVTMLVSASLIFQDSEYPRFAMI